MSIWELPVEHEAWMKHGRCTGASERADDWFPERANATRNTPELRRAIELCGTCPVSALCLDYAMKRLDTPERVGGVWGGTTEGMRRRRQHTGAA